MPRVLSITLLILFIFLAKVANACGAASQWLCEIGHGILMAESEGKNALFASGYAYHTTVAAHWPIGVSEQTPADPQGLNEIPYGLGYGRAWYNTATHEEYTLFAVAFSDSYWKPEMHVGYMYQKFHPLFENDNLEWGIGYSPQLFIKPSWTADSPLLIPFIGLTTSLRYKNFETNVTWANVLFVNLMFKFN